MGEAFKFKILIEKCFVRVDWVLVRTEDKVKLHCKMPFILNIMNFLSIHVLRTKVVRKFLLIACHIRYCINLNGVFRSWF